MTINSSPLTASLFLVYPQDQYPDGLPELRLAARLLR
jgi:hypothetical protein